MPSSPSFTRIFSVTVLFSMMLATGTAFADPLVLAENRQSDYRIVIAENAPAATQYAAEELQRFFKRATGVELTVVTDAEPAIEKEILIGDSQRLKELAPDADHSTLGTEGYAVRTEGQRLLLAGGQPRGTLYAVYDFLENELGCRWFTPSIDKVPKVDRLVMDPVQRTRTPPLEYREVMWFNCWDADWMARNRINTTKLPGEKHGGSVVYVPGYYVHTFNKLLPPDEYFEEHPAYFGEVEGERVNDGKICATNPEVAAIITEKVLRLFREHPEAKIISISQNDRKDDYCRCETCAALDAAEGTHAAQVLSLVNRVAEGVAKEFPDRAVETLAYEWSRKPPKTLRPRENVIIRLSTIRCSFSEPLETQPKNRPFLNDLKGWGDICNRVWIWDYTTYFSYYLLPWPNYRVMDDNIRFLIQNHVTGIVEQGNWQSPGGAMAELKGYLLARFLWNPELDEQTVTREFLEGVYGPAAPHIQAYLDLLATKVADEQIRLTIYGSRTPAYLTLDVLTQADALWEQAVEAVKDQPEVLLRVQRARMSPDYAYIEHFRWKPEGRITYAGRPGHSKVVAVSPDYQIRVERFLDASRGAGITNVREGDPDFEEYLTWLRGLLPSE